MEYFCRGRRKYVTKRGDQVERGFGREQTKVKGHGWDWKEKRERKTGLKQWRGKGVPQEDRSVVAHGHIEGIGRMGMGIDFIERAWIYSFVRASEMMYTRSRWRKEDKGTCLSFASRDAIWHATIHLVRFCSIQ